jgi:hypothetical protein
MWKKQRAKIEVSKCNPHDDIFDLPFGCVNARSRGKAACACLLDFATVCTRRKILDFSHATSSMLNLFWMQHSFCGARYGNLTSQFQNQTLQL